jgi:anaerobic selenocysteine-containing dehydrogenase
MMPGSAKMIFVTPHKTMGVAWAVANNRGLWLPINIGTDSVLHNALARIIIENGWQDQAFIDQWIAKPWEVDSGYGRGTRNTGWQWRTTWGTWQSDWEDYKKFILSQEESRLDVGQQDHRHCRSRHPQGGRVDRQAEGEWPAAQDLVHAARRATTGPTTT